MIRGLSFDHPDVKNRRSTFVVIGMTGAGKSSFLNLMLNWNNISTKNFEAVFDLVEHDSSKGKPIGSSVTDVCTPYVTDGRCFIDTPGLADVRGWDQDVINLNAIFSSLCTLGAINGLILVSPGRYSRFTNELQYVLIELFKYVPKEFKSNILYVFTGCGKTDLIFDKVLEGGGYLFNPDGIFTVDNVYSKIESSKQKNQINDEEILEELASEIKKNQRFLKTFHTKLDSLKVLSVKEMLEFKDSAARMSTNMREMSNLKKQLDDEKRQIEQCDIKIDMANKEKRQNSNYETTGTNNYWSLESNSYISTYCLFPGCYTTCHNDCGVGGHIYNCCAFNGKYCQKCSHDISQHSQGCATWVSKTQQFPVIDGYKKKCFELANAGISSAEELKMAKAVCLRELEKEEKKITDEVQRVVSVLNDKTLGPCFIDILKKQINHLITEYKNTKQIHLKESATELIDIGVKFGLTQKDEHTCREALI